MWTEIDRPINLDEMALAPDMREEIESYLAGGSMNHLFFWGPPGSGKSSLAGIIERQLAYDHIEVNASLTRNVTKQIVYRMKVLSFFRSLKDETPTLRYKITRVEEAESLEARDLTTLRRPMEQFTDENRLIFTSNKLPADPAFLDRCRVLELDTTSIPVSEKVRALRRIAERHHVELPDAVLVMLADRSPTMRGAVSELERIGARPTTATR